MGSGRRSASSARWSMLLVFRILPSAGLGTEPRPRRSREMGSAASMRTGEPFAQSLLCANTRPPDRWLSTEPRGRSATGFVAVSPPPGLWWGLTPQAGRCYHLRVSSPRVSPGTGAGGLPPEDLILNAVWSGQRAQSLILLQGWGVWVCLPAGSATLDAFAAESRRAGAPAGAPAVCRGSPGVDGGARRSRRTSV